MPYRVDVTRASRFVAVFTTVNAGLPTRRSIRATFGFSSGSDQPNASMTVRATNRDASRAKVTVSAKGKKNWLTMPPTKPSGSNTATVVSGEVVMRDGTDTGARPGALVRGARS